jgi:hypothetical protein
MQAAHSDLSPYLDRLASLRFVRSIALAPSGRGAAATHVLRVRTAHGQHRLFVDLRRVPLTAAQASRLVSERAQDRAWIHLVPSLSTTQQRRLADAAVNFVDLAGNLFLALGEDCLGQIEGRAPVDAPKRTGLARADVQVLLALMLDPGLRGATVRELAAGAGVSKSAAANGLLALTGHGLVLRNRQGIALAPTGLLDALLGLYEHLLRPKLVVGRYAVQERDPADLERRLEAQLGPLGRRWCLGGHSAAWRLVPHHRGEQTCLIVEEADAATAAALRLLPQADGPLTLMRSPGPVTFEAAPAPHVAPALLAYGEMLCTEDERSREAGSMLRATLLGDWR